MSRNVLLAATAVVASFGLATLAQAQPVTGLYIGAGGGANFLQQEQVRVGAPGFAPAYGNSGFHAGYVGLGSIGWGFGNGLRVEGEGDFRRNVYDRGNAALRVDGREEKYGGMVNALFDLDVGSPYVYPYVGAGVGYEHIDQRVTAGQSRLFGSVDGSDNGFAYQAIAGLSFPIPPVVGLSLTAEYRYFAVSGDHEYNVRVPGVAGAQLKTRGDYNHSLLLGLRYAFDAAPPPAAPAAVVTPPPAAEAARTYLVFFDWDRADLTPRARQVVSEAAHAATRVQVTRIEVNGYTDTSGTAQYNQSLSVRRAQSVANELVKDGVPRQAISMQGFGQTHLLVATADGVREPQNRRVEIILH